MTIAQLFGKIEEIICLHPDIKVENTSSEYLRSTVLGRANCRFGKKEEKTGPSLQLGVLSEEEAERIDDRLQGLAEWLYIRAREENGIELYVSHTWLLYRLACQLAEDWQERDIVDLTGGKICQPAFRHLRPAYDSLLNNHARTASGFDPEEHIREMARLGFTHVEVNGLAAHFPYEKAAPDELLYRAEKEYVRTSSLLLLSPDFAIQSLSHLGGILLLWAYI